MKKVDLLWPLYLILTALLVAAASCAQPAPTPAPTATSSPAAPLSPTLTTPPATPTPVPSPLPKPKPTLTPPPPVTSKPSPTPSASPSPSPSAKATPTVTPPPLTPAPTPVFIYTENFTKPGGWYTTSMQQYESGYPAPGQPPGYYITLKVPNYAVYTLDKFFGDAFDFTIQIDAKALTELQGLYGIAFRQSEKGESSYRFGVDYLNGRYSLSKVVSGNSTLLIPWTASPLLNKGVNQTNRLMVEAKQNTFNLYANGYLLNRYVDATDWFRLGVVRVFAISGSSPDVRVVFNDFKMRGD